MLKRPHPGVLLIDAACVFISALVWVFFVVQLRQEREEAIQSQARHNANLAVIFAQQAATPVQDVDGLLRDMRRAYHEKGRALRLEDVPTPMNLTAKALVYRSIVNENGNVVVGPAAPDSANLAGREYFKPQKSGDSDSLLVGTAVVGWTLPSSPSSTRRSTISTTPV